MTSAPFVQEVKRRYKRWNRKLSLTKRQQFVVVTICLTLGMLVTQLVSVEYRYGMVVLLSLASFFLTAFALRDDLSGIEWYTLLVLPALFTGAVALFYFLLPVRWLTRLPVAVLYAVGMYALLLTENIYNVAANRTIALLRAAHSVGFLLTLVTYYLLVQTVLSFRLISVVNSMLIGLMSLILLIPALWSMELDARVSTRVKKISLALSIAIIEISWALSYWPVKPTIFALFLTTIFYSLAGMAQQYLVEKLYKKTVIEFLIVAMIVLIIVFLGTNWRGNF